MTAEERLRGPRAKIARAKRHIIDLHKSYDAFLDTKPYVITTEDHPETGQYIKRLTKADPIDPDIPAIVGDVLFDLRSALDHIAYQLVLVGLGKSKLTDAEARPLAFPIGKTATHYEALCNTQVKGARPDAIKHLGTIEPYGGGKGDILWALKSLNDSDKHRLLVPAVCAADRMLVRTGSVFHSAVSRGIPTHWAAKLARESPIGINRLEITLTPQFNKAPLKLGDVVLTGPLDRKVYERVDFVLQITLHEPGVIEGKALLKTIQDIVDFVDGIVPTFEPLLT